MSAEQSGQTEQWQRMGAVTTQLDRIEALLREILELLKRDVGSGRLGHG